MSTLAQLRDRIELELHDSTNQVWSTDEVDAAIARTLLELGHSLPQKLQAAQNATATRDQDISAITGLIAVWDLIYPYDSAAPTWPEPRPKYRQMRDGYVTLLTDSMPAVGTNNLLVRYTALQTISGLAGAGATSLDLQEEELLVLGASAACALQQTQASINTVTVTGRSPSQWQTWGANQWAAFQTAITRLSRARSLLEDPRVHWAAKSRNEGKGGVV